MVILFESKDQPPFYLIGTEGSTMVQILKPGSDRLSPPVLMGSVANHMPYTEWQDFTGDDEAEKKILTRIAVKSD